MPADDVLAEVPLEVLEAGHVLLGAQPAQQEFFTALGPVVSDAVDWIYDRLKEGGDFSGVPFVNEDG